MPNRLADQQSPYLLQHKNNPVDWYPWGDEAFDRARSDDKPIFLRAYGMADKEASLKAETDTLFYIASSTKSFTGASETTS